MHQQQSAVTSGSVENFIKVSNVYPSMERHLRTLLAYVEGSKVLTAGELRKLQERGDIGSSRRSNPNDLATHYEVQTTKLAIDEKLRVNVSKAMYLIDLILSGWDGSCIDEDCPDLDEHEILQDSRILTAYSPYCIFCATKREAENKGLGKK